MINKFTKYFGMCLSICLIITLLFIIYFDFKYPLPPIVEKIKIDRVKYYDPCMEEYTQILITNLNEKRILYFDKDDSPRIVVLDLNYVLEKYVKAEFKKRKIENLEDFNKNSEEITNNFIDLLKKFGKSTTYTMIVRIEDFQQYIPDVKPLNITEQFLSVIIENDSWIKI